MGLLSKVFGVGKDNGVSGMLAQAEAELRNLRAPTAEELTYKLDNLVQRGVITPEQAKAYLVEHSAYEDIGTDPRLRDAQLGALSSLQEIGTEGGLTAMDRAKVEELASRTGQEERGAREAIVQHAAEQGRGGTPAELAALLANQQGAATRASQQGTDIAAMAQERALQALTQAGALGGQIRSQDFGEKSDVAAARDALAKFNAEHLQSTEAANVAARNAAQERNLAERQRIADTNVDTAGKNKEIAVNAKQTAYDNEMAKRTAIADAIYKRAQDARERSKEKSAFTGNIIGTAGTVGAGYLSKSDERSKDVSAEKPDMDAFLASLKPLSFKYKDPASPGAAPGENVGVTAQDVEKTPVGKTMVRNTPDGKMLDMQKGFSVILAGLAALHDKYEQMEKERAHV